MRIRQIPGERPSISGFFPPTLETEFAEFQRENPRFQLQRLDSSDAARIIHFCAHPEDAASTDTDQEAKAAAAEKYELVRDTLFIKGRGIGAAQSGSNGGDDRGRVTRSGALQRRRVVYDPNDVFRICAAAHLEQRHGGEVATARAVNRQCVGVSFDEVVWVVGHCRRCAPLEGQRTATGVMPSRNARRRARRARARQEAATTAGGDAAPAVTQQAGSRAITSVAWRDPRYNTTLTVRVLVDTVDMGSTFMAGSRHALFLHDIGGRVSVLCSLVAANDPSAVAQGIAFWATLRGPPQYTRFGLDGADADGLAGDTLRILRDRYGIESQRDTVPMSPAQPLPPSKEVLRGTIMARLLRNGPAAWDVVLRDVTIELNAVVRPGTATAHGRLGSPSDVMISEAPAELTARMRAMEIDGGDSGDIGQAVAGEAVEM